VDEEHARLRFEAQRFLLTPLSDLKHTAVNGHEIRDPVALQPGDKVGFGDFEFVFEQTPIQALNTLDPKLGAPFPLSAPVLLELDPDRNEQDTDLTNGLNPTSLQLTNAAGAHLLRRLIRPKIEEELASHLRTFN